MANEEILEHEEEFDETDPEEPGEDYEDDPEEFDPEESDEDYEDDAEETDPEEPGDDDEDFPLYIDYEDNGKIVTEKVMFSELPDILKAQKQSSAVLSQFESVANVLKMWESDGFFKEINQYRKQGYTDEQIKEGMYKVMMGSKAAPEEKKEFASVEDEIQYRINQAMDPYKKQIEAQTRDQFAREIAAHNDTTLNKALVENGWDQTDITPKEIQRMNATLQDIYPGFDIRSTKMSSRQADILIKEALGKKEAERTEDRKKSKEAARAKAIAKAAKAPKVLPGTRSKGKAEDQTLKEENVSREERKKRFRAL